MEDSFNPSKPQPKEKPVPIASAIDVFLDSKKGQNISSDVISKYRHELNRLRVYCESKGVYLLKAVTLPLLTSFRTNWEEEYPSSLTRRNVQGRLRSFFRFAVRADYISKNPAEGLSAIKVNEPPTLPVEDTKYHKILSTIPLAFKDERKRQRVHAFLQCMRHTGLAIGDAVRLERNQIIEDKKKGITRVVTTRQKTGTDVSVPIAPEIAKELLTVANGNQQYVFWNSGTGQWQSAKKRWERELKKLFRKAGLPDVHPHQFRDAFACELLSDGVPLEEVSKLLGHESVKTTEKHYAAWVKGRQDRLDDLVTARWKKRPRKSKAKSLRASA